MPNILFVCTANICRSPVAEAYFKDWLARNAVPGEWNVGSAGTWAPGGDRATPHSVEILKGEGLDLSRHRARRVNNDLMASADLVLCMTRSHLEALRVEFPDKADRIHMLASMAGAGYDIADPFGGPRAGYVEMTSELRGLIDAAAPRIVALALQGQT